MSKRKQLSFRGVLVRLSDGKRLVVSGVADSWRARILSRDVRTFCDELWLPMSARRYECHDWMCDLRRVSGFEFEPEGDFYWDDVSLPGVGFVRCRNRTVACVETTHNPQTTQQKIVDR